MALSETQRKDYSKRLSKALGQVQDMSRTVANAPEGSFNQNNQVNTQPVQQPQQQSTEQFNQPAAQPAQPQQAGSSFGIDNLGQRAGEAQMSPTQFSDLAETTTQLTTAERDQIRSDLGVSDAEADAFYIPEQGLRDMFEEGFDNSDLPEVKARMQSVQEQIDKTRSDLAESIEQIDENPFLAEETRVGRGQRRLSQAETKIGNLESRYNNLSNTYNRGLTELEKIMGYQDQDIRNRTQTGTAKLNYLEKLAERKATELQQERFSDEVSEEMVPYLQSYGEGGEPNVVGSATTGYYRWDKDLQKFVPIGGGAPSDGPGGPGQPGVDQDDTRANQSNIMSFQEFIRQKQLENNPWAEAQTPRGLRMLRQEYDKMVQSEQVDRNANRMPPLTEDETTSGDRRDLSQAGMSRMYGDVQRYFLGSDNAFQDWIQKSYASGALELPSDLTIQEIQAIEEEFNKAMEEMESGGSSRREP